MGTREEPGQEGLTEPQGVNTETDLDEEGAPDPDEQRAKVRHPPPDNLTNTGSRSDEMAGLPEQSPGHPGQQLSVDEG